MSPASNPKTLSAEMLQALEADLHHAAGFLDAQHYPAMEEMIAYHLGWRDPGDKGGGKRIRPLLTLLVCASLGGTWRSALPIASAIELIHNFSLVHDDIQDGSHDRRGRPTLWKRWGVPQALNTGDALLILARLSTRRVQSLAVSPSTLLDIQRLLDEACLQLTQGQHLDLAFEHAESVPMADYLQMIEGKTAALLAAATASGAQIAGASSKATQACTRFGKHLGLAFQVLDDILGIWGSPDAMGKPAGDDLRSRKKSLPVLHGLEHSREFRALWLGPDEGEPTIESMTAVLERDGSLAYARGVAERDTSLALAALEAASPSGQAGVELRDLAQQLLQRDR